MDATGSEATPQLQPPSTRSLVGASEILRALVVKDLKVKYKRSVLGFLWSLVTPIALTAVYLFVFIYVYKVPQKDFILFLLSGLLPWQFFNMSLLGATNSLVENAPLIRKVYFPRILLPAASVVSNLVNFLMGLGLFCVVVIATGRPLWLFLHWLILALVLESLLVLGIALAFSAWNVYLRDIQQLISIISLVLFFATPIVYDLSLVPKRFRWLILANPLSSVMQIYRSALYRAETPDPWLVVLGSIETAAMFVFGLIVFRRIAPNLAKEL